MKNICIFGASRSGKTTLSKMIAKKYDNYHVFNGDAIRGAFKDALPYTHINSKGGSGMKDDFPNFLSSLFYKHIKNNLGDFNYILETCDIEPEKAIKLFNKDNTIILYLGFPNQTPKQHYDMVRKYQKTTDWTYDRSDEEIKEHSELWTQKSREFEQKCNKYNIWFIDTSTCRENKLNETLEKLDQLLTSSNV